MDRRHFLISATALASLTGAGIYIAKNKKVQKKGTLLGAGRAMIAGQDTTYLGILNLDREKPRPGYFALSFFPHGIAFHPKSKQVLCVFEKKGPGAAEVHLKTGAVRIISTSPDRYFYGHGTYSSNGSLLYSTETILKTGEGVIAIRNAETFELTGFFPTYGKNPHDCQLIDGGRTLAITNGGGDFGTEDRGSVTFVDIASQKLLKQYPIDDDRFNAGHLYVGQSKQLAVVSAPRQGLPETDLGAISLLDEHDKLTSLKNPKEIVDRLKAETLSVCLDEKRNVVAATSPAGNLVTFWDLKTGKFLKEVEIENPRGITLDLSGHYYIVSQGAGANVLNIDADSLTLQGDSLISRAGFSGSHLYLLQT